ncbi:MAG: flavodoxin-dependent (E)-4-hydroxy-3-methylbut-2-enyl-diphosphate synthase [Erysipelotrichaceae bacterium]|nr:flavodoxin-dependent (E)-4-hydroxy-3-methylbut-2-enyl-diphosphate synthase [Erysipelotrichaceae bacterium]
MKTKKEVKIGNVIIGGNHPVAIQSMTNTPTKDIDKTVEQILALENIGCMIVRVAILDDEDALAITEIKKHINIPIVADIHFDYRLAIEAIKSGADKIRINPGNIGSFANVKKVVDVAKEYNIPIRIGINSGSVEKQLLEKYNGPTPEAMLESITNHVRLLESLDFHNIVLSIKSTNIENTIKTNELLNEHFDYPIHIGLTESGTVLAGSIRSSYALGVLLNKGIGSTIRVSLNGDPVNEIPTCKEILSMHNLYTKPTLICCPTCGRTKYNMVNIVNEIEKFLNTINSNITVAIMGCVVNGPGEARHADIGIAGGNNEAVLFKHGEIIRKIKEENIIEELKHEILNII